MHSSVIKLNNLHYRLFITQGKVTRKQVIAEEVYLDFIKRASQYFKISIAEVENELNKKYGSLHMDDIYDYVD